MFPLPSHDTLRTPELLGAALGRTPCRQRGWGLMARLRWEMELEGLGLGVLSLEDRAVAKLFCKSGFPSGDLSPPESCWTPGRGRGLTPGVTGSGWLIVALHTGSHRLSSLVLSFAAIRRETWRVTVKGSNWSLGEADPSSGAVLDSVLERIHLHTGMPISCCPIIPHRVSPIVLPPLSRPLQKAGWSRP